MRIVLQLNGQITALYTQALAWLKEQLCRLANNLRVSFTQAYLNVIDLLHHLSLRVHTVLLQSNDKLVGLIKMVQSHISENKIAQTPMVSQWIQAGLKYLGLAKTTLQRALQMFKKDK
jgi:predicted metalloenzyme YecM